MEQLLLPSRLQLRDDPGDGSATILGLAVPYDTPITLGAHTETIAAGAADPADVVGIPLLWQHDTTKPIGRIGAAANTADGLSIEARISPTPNGLEAITLLRDQVIKGLSIGFEPMEQSWDGPDVTRQKVRVLEVSIATLPAYAAAQITQIRNEAVMPETITTAPEVVPEQERAVAVATITHEPLDELRDRLDRLEARGLVTHVDPLPVNVRAILGSLVVSTARTVLQQDQQRALGGSLSTNNAGLLPANWASEVRGVLDVTRPVMLAVGSVPFPSAGLSVTYPKITQHATVAARGTEGTQVPTQALTTGTDTYTAVSYSGGVAVSLELVAQGDPGVVEMVVRDLLDQYAIATEKAVTLALETAATPTTAVLDFTSYKTFVAGVQAAGQAIYAATGQFGDRLALIPADWAKVIGFADADGRRILSTVNPVNADGLADLTAHQVDIGGVLAFFSPQSVENMQFNAKSARVAERPPETVRTVQAATLTEELAIWGMVIPLPLYPTGIRVHSLTMMREGGKR